MSTPRPEVGGPYTVQEGDTITEIAFLAYGDARRYVDLAEHNKDVPGFAPARLRSGLVITIPEPDYLPRPSGLGGMRGGAGQTFALRDGRSADGSANRSTDRSADGGDR